jgi:hypothetical protein
MLVLCPQMDVEKSTDLTLRRIRGRNHTLRTGLAVDYMTAMTTPLLWMQRGGKRKEVRVRLVRLEPRTVRIGGGWMTIWRTGGLAGSPVIRVVVLALVLDQRFSLRLVVLQARADRAEPSRSAHHCDLVVRAAVPRQLVSALTWDPEALQSLQVL